MTVVEWTTSQWGYADDPGHTWVDLAFDDGPTILLDDRIEGASRRGGFVFDGSLLQDFSNAPQITALRFSARYSVPVFEAGGGSDNSIELLVVPDPTPENYASGEALCPTHRGIVSLGELVLPIAAFPDSEVVDFILGDAALAIVQSSVTDDATWAGRIAFTLRATGTNTIYVSNGPSYPVLLTTTQEAVSAVQGSSASFRRRIVVSSKPETRSVHLRASERPFPSQQGIMAEE